MIYLLSGAFLGALNKHKLNMRIQGVVAKNINVKRKIKKKSFHFHFGFYFIKEEYSVSFNLKKVY